MNMLSRTPIGMACCSGFLLLLYVACSNASPTTQSQTRNENRSLENFSFLRSEVTNLLPQKTVNQVLVDGQGLMWIETQQGFHQFDGYSLNHFPQNTKGLGARIANGRSHIELDRYGRVWVITSGVGLSYYDPDSMNFKKVSGPTEYSTQSNRDVTAFFLDKSGYFWVGSTDGSVQIFDPKVRRLSKTPKIYNDLGWISGFTSDRDQNIWVTDLRGQILICAPPYAYCEEHETWASEAKLHEVKRISSVFTDTDHNIWIGTEDSGLFRFDRKMRLDKFPHERNNPNSVSSNTIKDIFEDSVGRIWIATEFGLDLHKGAGKFHRFNFSNSGLGETSVISVDQDTTNQLWIGTRHGLFKGLESPFRNFNKKSGLGSNSIVGFSNLPSNQVLVRPYDAPMQLLSDQGDLSAFSKLKDSFPPARYMSSVLINNTLWLGHRIHGLYCVNLATGYSQILNLSQADNVSEQIARLEQIDDQLYIGTFGMGAYRAAEPACKTKAESDWGLTQLATNSKRIFSFTELEDGLVLIGTLQGLELLSTASNSEISLNWPGHSPLAKDMTKVTDVALDESGNVWIGTENVGLYKWERDRDSSTEQVTRIETIPPIPTSTIYSLELDGNEDLWLGTAKGLIRVDITTYEAHIFDQNHGLPDEEFNIHASHADDMGRLYFGGHQGFTRFHPDEIKIDQTRPPLRLTDIRIEGKSIEYDVAYSKLRELKLTHKDYLVDFEFSVLDFTNPERNRYQYKLENYEDAWVDLGTQHSVSFSDLPSGKYTLRISGANSNGIASEEDIVLPISVYPPPWLSWYAFATYEISLIGMFLFGKRIAEGQKEGTRAVDFALEMKASAERAMDNLHLQIITEKSRMANMHIHAVDTLQLASNLLGRQAELLDDELVRTGFADNQQRLRCLELIEANVAYMHDEVTVNIRQFADALFDDLLDSRGAENVEITSLNQCLDIYTPVRLAVPVCMIINELVVNSLRHAFEGLEGRQTLVVRFEEALSRDGWELEISDSGLGLPESIDPENPATTGMEIVHQFYTELGASFAIDRSHGTRFLFHISKTQVSI